MNPQEELRKAIAGCAAVSSHASMDHTLILAQASLLFAQALQIVEQTDYLMQPEEPSDPPKTLLRPIPE